MSEVKVNKITPRTDCGTTQIGDSGDTVTVTGDLRSDSLKAADGGVIISQSGTTITVGASGDTVSLASGASQSGFGRNGAVDWQTTVKTSTFTATAGEGYFVDTSSGGFTVNLPAGTAGAIVGFSDYAKTFDTNNVTLDLNGTDKAAGSTTNPKLVQEGIAVTLVFVDSTKGWIVTDSGLQSEANQAQFITATGGTITTVCTNFKVHTFTGPGTFCVSAAGNACGSNTVDYLVVAGGGGGGDGAGSSTNAGGGGGAGGYRESPGTASGSYTVSPLGTSPAAALPVAVAGYPVTVGGGGATNTSGSNSVFTGTTTITSAAGGGGGSGSTSQTTGHTGGSGGGANTNPGAGAAGNTPPVSPPQGNPGGSGLGCTSGGGGGATAAGGDAAPGSGGSGGAGATSSINGTPTTRAAGGDGGPTTGPAGTPQADNSGNGGPRGGHPGAAGGTGGSGIVIIRYKFQ